MARKQVVRPRSGWKRFSKKKIDCQLSPIATRDITGILLRAHLRVLRENSGQNWKFRLYTKIFFCKITYFKRAFTLSRVRVVFFLLQSNIFTLFSRSMFENRRPSLVCVCFHDRYLKSIEKRVRLRTSFRPSRHTEKRRLPATAFR